MVRLDLVEEEAEMVQEVVNAQASGFPSQLESTQRRDTNVSRVPEHGGGQHIGRYRQSKGVCRRP